METIDFSKIAKKYREISTAQSSASENLFKMLDIKSGESVLDAGCGTGNLTSKIKALTNSRVTGIDISDGMVKEALKNYGALGIEFLTKNLQELDFDGAFHVIFSNSTFQWCTDAEISAGKFFKALKPVGRMAIQAPATQLYCPNFVTAIDKIINYDENIKRVFSTFKNPWLFFETAEEYAKIFEADGFKVALSRIEAQSSLNTPEKVFEIFSSGAIAGYLNQDYYPSAINKEYIELFKNLMMREFRSQADGSGLVNLIFNRVYLLAFKPAN
jgi:trans-aconitate methyltransferase